MHVLTTWADLLAASNDAPVVRYDLAEPLRDPAYAVDGAVAFVHRAHGHTPGLCLLGSPDAVGALLASMVSEGVVLAEADHVTLPTGSSNSVREALRAAGSGVALGGGADWEWMHTTSAPAVQPGEDRLSTVRSADLWGSDGPARDRRVSLQRELVDLLETHNGRTDARPFEGPDERWVLARDASGALLAIGVDEPNVAGLPVLEGITTSAAARGQGLGAAVTALLTRDAVARAGVCTLGLYADNEVARRLYLRLGYTLDHRFSSHELILGS